MSFPVGSLPARAPGSAGLCRAGAEESGWTRVAEPRRGEEAAPAARCSLGPRSDFHRSVWGFPIKVGGRRRLGAGISRAPRPCESRAPAQAEEGPRPSHGQASGPAARLGRASLHYYLSPPL